MQHIKKIVKRISNEDISKLDNGLDELLFKEEGREHFEYILINHPKTRIYSPNIWPTFRKAVMEYISENKESLRTKDIKNIAREMGVTHRTLQNAILEEKIEIGG